MKRQIIPIILTLFSVNIALSQNIPKVMPPSPNASTLAQYANVPTNNYTGVPNISIPLYTIKSGEIELPISLSYHASGIKVSQEASSAGLGWALNAGGVITRSVNGVDDLKPIYGYTIIDDLPTTNSDQVIFGNTMEHSNTYNQINSGLLDGKPDMLYYNFLGESGKMIFDKKQPGNNKIKGIPLKQTNTTFVYDTDKKEWEVTDGNGWKYYFNVKEISRNYNTSDSYFFPSYLVNDTEREARFDRIDQSVNFEEYLSAWYIRKIITPKEDVITFEYDEAMERRGISQLNFYEQESYYGFPLFTSSEFNNTWYGSFNEKKNTISVNMSSSDDINLKKIIFKNGYIQFNTSDRDDQRQRYYLGIYSPKPQKLNSFEIFDSYGKSIKKVDFNYSYFNGNVERKNKENYWRLRLDSIQESFFDNASNTYKKNPSYTFAYNSIDLPAKTSASTDHWGYYNGFDNDHIRNYKDVTQSLYMYNSSEYNYVQNPILIRNSDSPQDEKTYQSFLPYQIESGPSSSSTSYPFLSGAYREPHTDKMQAGILTRINYPTGGATKFTYEPNKSNPNKDQSAYRYDEAGTSVWHNGDSADDESRSFNLNEYTIVNIECSISSSSTSQLANVKAFISTSSRQPIIRFDPNTTDFKSYTQLILPPGSYYLTANTHALTESVTIFMRVRFIRQFITDGTIVGAGLRILKQESLDTDGNVKTKRVYDYNYQGSNWTSGIAMSDIQHFYKDGGSREYSSPEGYPITSYNNVIIRSSDNNTPLSSSAQGNHVGYTQVSVSDEDQSGNKLGKTTYHYSNSPDEDGSYHLPGMPVITHMNNGDLIKEEHYNAKGDILKTIENKYVKDDPSSKIIKGIFTKTVSKDPSSSNPYNGIFISRYRIYSEWWHLEKTIEKIHGINRDTIVTTTNYNYENPLHKKLTKTTTINSKGQTIISKNKYPQDLQSGIDETSAAIISGMTAQNIINPILQTETTINGNLAKGTINNFKIKSYTDENNISKNMYLPKNIKTLEEGSATNYYKKADFVDYGKYGNLNTYKQTDGITTVYLWGYKEEHPVAKIENASLASVESTLTTTELNNLKNGTLDQTTMISVLNKIRTLLPNAMVTTYTYIPLVGVSSITDHKGNTITYTYDSAGRLQFVKDKDGNILSANEYHYKGQ